MAENQKIITYLIPWERKENGNGMNKGQKMFFAKYFLNLVGGRICVPNHFVTSKESLEAIFEVFESIVATLQTWNWRCPQPLTKHMKIMVFRAFRSDLSFRAHFQAPKSIFENHFRIVPSAQIWVLMTFWMSGSDWEHISDHLQALEKFWRTKIFRLFSSNFGLILA